MEYMLNKIEREDLLAGVMTEVTQSKSKPKKEDSGIYVDPNFKLSEDAKFGNKLAQDDRAWNNYFGEVK
jgi:hypothetical protein